MAQRDPPVLGSGGDGAGAAVGSPGGILGSPFGSSPNRSELEFSRIWAFLGEFWVSTHGTSRGTEQGEDLCAFYSVLFKEKPSVVRPKARGRGKLGVFWFYSFAFSQSQRVELNSQLTKFFLRMKTEYLQYVSGGFFKIYFEKMLLNLQGFSPLEPR